MAIASSKTRIRGITIELDGDATGLTSELKNVNGALKNTQSALRDVDKLLKLDPGNTQLLEQKQRLLNTAIEETRRKLETEKRTLEEISSKNTTGELQQQQDALQREVIETEDKLKSLEMQLKSFGSVGAQQFKALGEKLKEIGGKLTNLGTQMTARFTVPIVAGFTAAIKSASDYEENISKMEVAFGRYAESVRNFTDNAIDQFGLSKVEASEAASAFGALAKGIGLTEDTAAEMAITLTGLTSDLSSYFNQSTDVSAKALEAIFTGEAEALKKFGVVMTQTNLEDFAAQHGKVYSAASEAEKVMIRYNYVLEKTKDAQGDYARTSDGFANTFRTFKAALQDLAVEVGQVLLPIITPIIKKLTEWVKKFSKLPEGVKKAIVSLLLFVAVAGPVITAIGGMITAIGGLVTAFGAIGVGVAGATAGVGALGVAVAAAGAAVLVAAAAFTGYLIVRAISENADAIRAGWQKLSNDVTTTLNNAVNNVKVAWYNLRQAWTDAPKVIANGIKTMLTDAGRAFANFCTNAVNGFASLVVGIGTRVSDGMRAAGNAIKSGWNTVTTIVSNAANSVWNAVAGAMNSMKTTIASAAISFKNNLVNAFNSARTAAETAFMRGYNSVTAYIQTAFRQGAEAINSFKTQAVEKFNSFAASASNVYKNITEGIAEFKVSADARFRELQDIASAAFNAMGNYANAFAQNTKTYFGTIKTSAADIFNNAYDSVKSIIGNAFTSISTAANTLKTNIIGYWKDIKSSAKEQFAGTIDSVYKHISGAFTDLTKVGQDFASKIKSSWDGLKSSAASIFGAGGSYDNIFKTIKGMFDSGKDQNGVFEKAVKDAWDGLSAKCASIFGTIKKTIMDTFSTGSKTAKEDNDLLKQRLEEMDKIINEKMETAKTTISNAWSKVKETLSQKLSWNFEGVTTKQPKITTTGKFDVDKNGNIIKTPTLSMIWQKSAMQLGHILSGATIFGMMNGKLLGAGEAGKEVVVGASSLNTMVHNAAQAGNSQIVQQLALTNQLLAEYLPECAADNGVSGADVVGQIMPAINRSLGMMLT